MQLAVYYVTLHVHLQGNLLHATQTSAMSDDPRHLTADDGDEGGMRRPTAPLQRGSSTVIPGSRVGWARAHRCDASWVLRCPSQCAVAVANNQLRFGSWLRNDR